MAVKRGRSISSFGQLFGAISGGSVIVGITPELISHKDIPEITARVMAEVTSRTLGDYSGKIMTGIPHKTLTEIGEKNITQYGG